VGLSRCQVANQHTSDVWPRRVSAVWNRKGDRHHVLLKRVQSKFEII